MSVYADYLTCHEEQVGVSLTFGLFNIGDGSELGTPKVIIDEKTHKIYPTCPQELDRFWMAQEQSMG